MSVELTNYEHGRLLYLPNDIYMGRFLRDHGQYSPGEVEVFRTILRPGDVVIEAGANIGCHTIPMAKMVQENGGTVLAMEPQLHLYYLLCGNVALNGLTGTVRCVNMAAGAESGMIGVPKISYDDEGNFGGLPMTAEMADANRVSMVALDSLLGSISGIRLIKADVEGMEADVIRGASNLICRHRPFLYVEDDRPANTVRLRALIKRLEYRVYSHRPLYVTAEDRAEDLRSLGSANLLCVPTEANVKVSDLEEV